MIKNIQYKQLILGLTFIVINIAIFSNCKALIKRSNDFENVIDVLYFNHEGNLNDYKYPISKEFLKDKTFILKYNGNIFFEGNDSHEDYLYEGFQERYFFITPMQKRNNLASPFDIKRDSVFLFDTKDKLLYSFNADKFTIQSFKKPRISIEAIKKQKDNGFRLGATYYSINTETNELFLLLEDLQTIEKIQLNLIK